MAGRACPLIVPPGYREDILDIRGSVGTPRMVYDPETGAGFSSSPAGGKLILERSILLRLRKT